MTIWINSINGGAFHGWGVVPEPEVSDLTWSQKTANAATAVKGVFLVALIVAALPCVPKRNNPSVRRKIASAILSPLVAIFLPPNSCHTLQAMLIFSGILGLPGFKSFRFSVPSVVCLKVIPILLLIFFYAGQTFASIFSVINFRPKKHLVAIGEIILVHSPLPLDWGFGKLEMEVASTYSVRSTMPATFFSECLVPVKNVAPAISRTLKFGHKKSSLITGTFAFISKEPLFGFFRLLLLVEGLKPSKGEAQL